MRYIAEDGLVKVYHLYWNFWDFYDFSGTKIFNVFSISVFQIENFFIQIWKNTHNLQFPQPPSPPQIENFFIQIWKSTHNLQFPQPPSSVDGEQVGKVAGARHGCLTRTRTGSTSVWASLFFCNDGRMFDIMPSRAVCRSILRGAWTGNRAWSNQMFQVKEAEGIKIDILLICSKFEVLRMLLSNCICWASFLENNLLLQIVVVRMSKCSWAFPFY